ncbi:MAG: hypothetical protein QHJ73_02615, partial [Armatimonadota bacterium]|nr:hypothetical protein [Armatimonadota bacterium]
GWHLYVKHCKWSSDGRRLLFVVTNEIRFAPRYGELPLFKEIYVVNADGTGLRRVGPFGNHPIWHPNCREILTNSPFPGRPGKSLVLIDAETGERRLASPALPGSGHPSYSPDGSLMVVEHVAHGTASIRLVHVGNDTVETLVRPPVLDHSHSGTHLHPVWSREGQQVLYASDASGTAQLCVVDV